MRITIELKKEIEWEEIDILIQNLKKEKIVDRVFV